MQYIKSIDPEIAAVIDSESNRQEYGLNLIASENTVSRAVMEAQGSIMTNKYAEGYPGKRYYGGCKYMDQAENLAIERAKRLFGVDFANVQPHSGSQANMAAYFALLSSRGWYSSHGPVPWRTFNPWRRGKLFRTPV